MTQTGTTSGGAPKTVTLWILQQPQATAGSAGVKSNVRVPYMGGRTGKVTAARYIPIGAAAKHADNYRTFTITNKKGDASGTAVVGTITTHSDDAAGVSLADATSQAFVLSSTAADLAVSAGHVLQVTSAATGTGVADPGGTIEIDVDFD